jgi:uncharacterized protein (DUF302 family)
MNALNSSCLIEHTTVETGLSYKAAAAAFESSIGRLDPQAAEALRARHAPWADVEREMERMAGPSGLMLFTKVDQGAIASLGETQVRCRLYLVGNPAIAAHIVRIDPRGSFYVPFRVSLYEQTEGAGAVLSFDRPSSFLGVLDQAGLRDIGLQLDEKIDAVMRRITASSTP